MKSIQNEIFTYYNQLASDYDQNRFGNSYGQFIHHQEEMLLRKFLKTEATTLTLDLGCGTGRFLHFANCGLDISPNMIAEARKKYPEKQLLVSSGTAIPFPSSHFHQVFSFHVLMHLSKPYTSQILKEVHRIIQKGGLFICDFPSTKRRRFLGFRSKNWHGANDFTLAEWKRLLEQNWEIKTVRGILFFPIHRFPVFLRKLLKMLSI